MKTEQFKRCVEKLVQEYERSKGKHPNFDSVDRAWRAIQREFSEVVNESLRDTIKPEALAEEMLHLSNVAMQGYMFLTKAPEKYVPRDDFGVIEKENKAMNKEYWDGVIEACNALRDGKEAQYFCNGKWNTLSDQDIGKFYAGVKYRAKPEPKLRPLTPQEWLEALMAGKRVYDTVSFSITSNYYSSIWIELKTNDNTRVLHTPKEMISRKFSDGSPCGVEMIE